MLIATIMSGYPSPTTKKKTGLIPNRPWDLQWRRTVQRGHIFADVGGLADWNDSVAVSITTIQWPFQEPKLEVPTIYKAYVRPM